jgi:CBS domain-containing protein
MPELHPTPTHRTQHVPTARDVMTDSLVTLGVDMSIFDAIRALIENQISGAPVLGPAGQLLGMLSELDCLGVLASDQFYEGDHMDARVGDYMSTDFETVGPECDIYMLAQYFREKPARRFPVLEGSRLIGQVSQRDVLRGIDQMRQKRVPRKHYPDYREPV